MRSLVDRVVDILNETALFEMAHARKEAIARISNLNLNIARHLTYVLLSKDRRPIGHWTKEINAWLFDVDDLVELKTGKRLDVTTLFEILFEGPMGELSQIAKYVKRAREGKGVAMADPTEDTKELLRQIIKRICVDIHSDRFEGIEHYLPEVTE